MNKRIEKLIDRVIRVNYAGECGAKEIYSMQVKTENDEMRKSILERMLSEELVHLKYFERAGKEHQIRPTLFHPIWKIGSSFLGFVTGKLGFESSMACTAGVEEVIENHYKSQLNEIDDILSGGEVGGYDKILRGLKTKIEEFLKDETKHKEEGLSSMEENLKCRMVRLISKGVTRVAVGISSKI